MHKIKLRFLHLIGSAHPAHIRWRHVFWGIGIQFTFGLITLRWPTGRAIFDCIGDKVRSFLFFTDAGSGFVFGYLVNGKPLDLGLILSFQRKFGLKDFSFCDQ